MAASCTRLFAKAGAGNAHEARLALELGDRLRPDIAHGGAQACGELVHDGADRAAIGATAQGSGDHDFQQDNKDQVKLARERRGSLVTYLNYRRLTSLISIAAGLLSHYALLIPVCPRTSLACLIGAA